mmetsp:Transcript_43534/g.81778  ORF Transcript_43534/g.81778 Transcript_43534/m.81778 type:complete len:330 (-) Transcript_43534:55-1044(-)
MTEMEAQAASLAESERTRSSMPADVVEDNTILFAIPKKGRLHEEVVKLLNGAGLNAKRPERLDVAMCKELPVKLVFLPAADIPMYVLEGDVDLGITGNDMIDETLFGEGFSKETDVEVLLELGFGKCKLCLQAPVSLGKYLDPKSFVGKRIVTSFPNLTERFFKGLSEEGSPKTKIKVISGSVEAACGLGLADAIVDLVETGTTMRAAGLDVVSEIRASQAVMFRRKVPDDSVSQFKRDLIALILRRMSGYITATRFVMVIYNCHEKDLGKCCQVTPGKRSPTVTQLKEEGWHSVSALVAKEKQNTIMDELIRANAEDILCMPLDNTRL